MKKRIVGLTAVLVLVTGITAAGATGATTQTADKAQEAKSMTSLNHSVATTNTISAMQMAVDKATAKAAEEAAREAAAAAATQVAAAQVAAANVNTNNNNAASSTVQAVAPAENEGDIYSILAGFGVDNVGIAYGDAQGYEAISYYKTGYIIINPNHTVSLYALIAHEVNHIVAYRESGKTTE